MRDLYELARPFPAALVQAKPGAYEASFVSHGHITSRLLEVVGPFDWSIAKIIMNAEGIAVGCIGRLEVVVDGRPVVIEEVGDVERPGASSATNLKNASSDALKRAAMRLGLGLHLWVGESYYLHRSLEKRLEAAESAAAAAEGEDSSTAVSAQQAASHSVQGGLL